MLVFKAFALVGFHVFSAASPVFDEMDVSVLFLLNMKSIQSENMCQKSEEY